MRPADFLILGAILTIGGLLGVKIEQVLARVSRRELKLSEANLAGLVCLTGVALFATGLIKLFLY